MYLSLRKLLEDALVGHLPPAVEVGVGGIAGRGAGSAGVTDEKILAQLVLLKLEMLRYASSSYEQAAKTMFAYLNKSSGVRQPLVASARAGVLDKLKSYRAAVKHGWSLPADAGAFIVTALGANPPSKLATRLRKALHTESKKMMDYYERLCPGFAARPDAVAKFGIAPDWTPVATNESFQTVASSVVNKDSLAAEKPERSVLDDVAVDWNRSMSRLFGAEPLPLGDTATQPTGDAAWDALCGSPVGKSLCLEMRLLLSKFLPQTGGSNVWYTSSTALMDNLKNLFLFVKEDKAAGLDVGLRVLSPTKVIMYNRNAWLAMTGTDAARADIGMSRVKDAMGLEDCHLVDEGAKSAYPVLELTTQVLFDIRVVRGKKTLEMCFSVHARSPLPKVCAALAAMRAHYPMSQVGRRATLITVGSRAEIGRRTSFSLSRTVGSDASRRGFRGARTASSHASRGGLRMSASGFFGAGGGETAGVRSKLLAGPPVPEPPAEQETTSCCCRLM